MGDLGPGGGTIQHFSNNRWSDAQFLDPETPDQASLSNDNSGNASNTDVALEGAAGLRDVSMLHGIP